MTKPYFQFIPMRSVGQFVAGESGGPLPYMWNIAGPLALIQSELHWHVYDLCRFHQIMYADLSHQSDQLDERYAHYKELIKKQRNLADAEHKEAFDIQETRIYTSIRDRDIEIERIKNFCDEFSVIGLWATAEVYMGKIFAYIEHYQNGVPVDDVQCPYRWNDFAAQYSAKSIVLYSLNGYADADECRVLNNTIKHSGLVNDRLAQFAFFAPHRGKRLVKVDFEMQRYVNGVFNFLGSLIESGNRLLDPSFEY